MFKEDFSVFFNTNEFAETIGYKPANGILRPVTGIFDRQYYESNDSMAGVSSSSPTVLIPESEVPEIAYGDEFFRNFKPFYVRTIEPDGTGLLTVSLEAG